jgi:hypothetical protein
MWAIMLSNHNNKSLGFGGLFPWRGRGNESGFRRRFPLEMPSAVGWNRDPGGTSGGSGENLLVMQHNKNN